MQVENLARFRRQALGPAGQAGILFAASGLLAFASAAAQGGPARGIVAVGLLDVVAAIVFLALPWPLWPPRATLVVAPAAFGVIAYANRMPSAPAQSYGVFFVLVFAWLGVHHPVGATRWLAPLGAAFYVLPLIWSGQRSAVVSVIVVIPVCVLVAELIGRDRARSLKAEAVTAHQTHLLRVVNQAAQEAARLDSSDVLRALVKAAISLGYDGAYLARFDEGDRTYTAYPPEALPKGMAAMQPIDAGLPGAVHRSGQTVVTADYPEFDNPVAAAVTAGYRTVIGAPVRVDGNVVGALIGGYTARRVLPEADREAFELLAEHAGRALGNARQFEEKDRHASSNARDSVTDDLTGLGNRRHGNSLLSGLSDGDGVVLLDLDHFKAVNDNFGHATGDRVLEDLANFLRAELRGGDNAARYGGEEFLVVLRDPADGGVAAAQRLITEWRRKEPLATLSGGLAVHRQGQLSAVTIGDADSALYEAKRKGRDRLELAASSTPAGSSES